MNSCTTTARNEVSLLISVRDLAVVLGISVRTLWRLEASGKLPKSVRVGRSRRWPRKVIEDWVAAGCPSPNSFDRTRKAAVT